MARAFRRGRSPSRAFTRAAASFTRTVASTNAGWARRPEMGKFSTARAVCAPQSADAGTRTSPIVSFSIRVRAPTARAAPRVPAVFRRAMCVPSRVHARRTPARADPEPSVSADEQPDRRFEDRLQGLEEPRPGRAVDDAVVAGEAEPH